MTVYTGVGNRRIVGGYWFSFLLENIYVWLVVGFMKKLIKNFLSPCQQLVRFLEGEIRISNNVLLPFQTTHRTNSIIFVCI